MANEPAANESIVVSTETPRRGGYGVDPEDTIGPTCMFWAMLAGFIVLGGMIVIWGLSNIDKI
jgi:hypothetical protein